MLFLLRLLCDCLPPAQVFGRSSPHVGQSSVLYFHFPDTTFGKVPVPEHSWAHSLITPLCRFIFSLARTLLKPFLTSTRPFPDHLGPRGFLCLSALWQWPTLLTMYWELTLKISPNPHSIHNSYYTCFTQEKTEAQMTHLSQSKRW